MISIGHVTTRSIRVDDTTEGRLLGYSAPIIFLGVRAKQKGTIVTRPPCYYLSVNEHHSMSTSTAAIPPIKHVSNILSSLNYPYDFHH